MKGNQVQDDCAVVVKKLRAMIHSTEEQLRAQKKQTLFLTQLTAKTMPKGLHCLPLRLTTEYYNLNSSEQEFPNQEKLEDPQLYHYAIFSDNILATAVVVNSTVSNAKVNYFSFENFIDVFVVDKMIVKLERKCVMAKQVYKYSWYVSALNNCFHYILGPDSEETKKKKLRVPC